MRLLPTDILKALHTPYPVNLPLVNQQDALDALIEQAKHIRPSRPLNPELMTGKLATEAGWYKLEPFDYVEEAVNKFAAAYFTQQANLYHHNPLCPTPERANEYLSEGVRIASMALDEENVVPFFRSLCFQMDEIIEQKFNVKRPAYTGPYPVGRS